MCLLVNLPSDDVGFVNIVDDVMTMSHFYSRRFNVAFAIVVAVDVFFVIVKCKLCALFELNFFLYCNKKLNTPPYFFCL